VTRVGDKCQTVRNESPEGFYDHVEGNDNEGKEQYFFVIRAVRVIVSMVVGMIVPILLS
jgi:hypothetical protein